MQKREHEPMRHRRRTIAVAASCVVAVMTLGFGGLMLRGATKPNKAVTASAPPGQRDLLPGPLSERPPTTRILPAVGVLRVRSFTDRFCAEVQPPENPVAGGICVGGTDPGPISWGSFTPTAAMTDVRVVLGIARADVARVEIVYDGRPATSVVTIDDASWPGIRFFAARIVVGQIPTSQLPRLTAIDSTGSPLGK